MGIRSTRDLEAGYELIYPCTLIFTHEVFDTKKSEHINLADYESYSIDIPSHFRFIDIKNDEIFDTIKKDIDNILDNNIYPDLAEYQIRKYIKENVLSLESEFVRVLNRYKDNNINSLLGISVDNFFEDIDGNEVVNLDNCKLYYDKANPEFNAHFMNEPSKGDKTNVSVLHSAYNFKMGFDIYMCNKDIDFFGNDIQNIYLIKGIHWRYAEIKTDNSRSRRKNTLDESKSCIVMNINEKYKRVRLNSRNINQYPQFIKNASALMIRFVTNAFVAKETELVWCYGSEYNRKSYIDEVSDECK